MITRNAFGLAALLFFGIGTISPPAHAENISACPTTISTPGTYTVTKNLKATGTCITVATSATPSGTLNNVDIVIDLHGHTITGNGTGSGITDTDLRWGCNAATAK